VIRTNVKAAVLSLGVLAVSLSALTSCNELVPDKVALSPEGADVEMISDPPNGEVYQEIGGASGVAMGVEKTAAFNEARNALRNDAARKGGTIVKVDDVTAKLAWDVGQTVVRITGTVYKPRQ
jgi:hypothetical protein